MTDVSDSDRVWRAVRVRLVFVHTLIAVCSFVYSLLALDGGETIVDIIGLAASLCVGISVCVAIDRRIYDTACAELGSDAMSPRGRLRVLTLPARLSVAPLTMWLVAAVGWTIGASLNIDARHGFRTGIAVLLTGMTAVALCFLLVERAMHPLVRLALLQETPRKPTAAGIRPRLLLCWLLGSGIPLLGMGLLPLTLEGGAWQPPVVTLALIGLGVGIAMLILGLQSVLDPLDRLRVGLVMVEGGRTDVSLLVDDGSEVGQLQSSFNRMVAGLREREQLRTLFSHHVGAEVARHALEHGDVWAAAQREASVLFVDVIGSTSMAQDRPPEVVVEMLNAFFEVVVRSVDAEGGWVNKFAGDGAMCVFGAPHDQIDHASRCLRAARAIRASIVELATRYSGLDAAVGVSSGTVVAGNVGAVDRYEYTLIGDPVNEAARLTEAAKLYPARVLASDATVCRADEEALRWSRGDELALRGRSHPTIAFAPAEDAIGALLTLEARSTDR